MFPELKPCAHLSYQLSQVAFVTGCVSCFLKSAVTDCVIFFTRAINAGYSTCWIISSTGKHFLTVCVRPELLPQSTRQILPLEMVNNSLIVTEALLEDKLADFWPDVPCLYDVRCSNVKNRELQDKALQELAEKLGTSCKLIFDLMAGRPKTFCYNCHILNIPNIS